MFFVLNQLKNLDIARFLKGAFFFLLSLPQAGLVEGRFFLFFCWALKTLFFFIKEPPGIKNKLFSSQAYLILRTAKQGKSYSEKCQAFFFLLVCAAKKQKKDPGGSLKIKKKRKIL